ncbi:MAG: ABC transporter ATP-binding protein, partial [Verrucomicrobia bacterium]|nr:ABC transporter ATP-binding protein [Verrucomicrobiota bacterium]
MALLEVKNLRTWFPVTGGLLRRHIDDVKAVDDVSFSIAEGETL